ncbi:MAG TPA: hypothetical protein DDW52_08335 [Planctomycetaceae bacterium]|nr:hypothetical protein [Planctomycetaceae bacterium]
MAAYASRRVSSGDGLNLSMPPEVIRVPLTGNEARPPPLRPRQSGNNFGPINALAVYGRWKL